MSVSLHAAWRALRHSRLTAVTAIITLALGVGATTTIYSVVDHAMLQPLPWPASDELMELSITTRERGSAETRSTVWSMPKFATMQRLQRSFSDVAAYTTVDVLLGGSEGSDRVRAEMVTGGYFALTRLPVQFGRALQRADDSAGTAVTILGHALWMRRFGGDSSVIGRQLDIGSVRAEVVGVAAPSAQALSGPVALWVPMGLAPRLYYPEVLRERWAHSFDAIARRRPGVSLDAAIREVQRLGVQVAAEHPLPEADGSVWGASARALRDARHDPTLARAILLLLGAVSCVLLIACVNVGNLLLARAAGREREFAVRLAIGARRGHLLRQMLTETVLLSLVGGLVGMLGATWAVAALREMDAMTTGVRGTQAAQFLDLSQLQLHGGVLAFGLALSLLTGVVCGILPAWRGSRPSLTGSLKAGAGASTEGSLSFRRGQSRALLVVGNVALSLLLLVGAGLLARSFAKARGVDGGFSPGGVLTLRVQTPDDTALMGAGRVVLLEQLLERLAAIPGTEQVGLNTCAPLSQACNGTIVLSVNGTVLPESGPRPSIGVHVVSEGYLRAIGGRLLAGRFLEPGDRGDGAPRVGVLSESAAKLLFPRGDAVGKRLGIGFSAWSDAEVVGVVADVNYGAVGEPAAPAFYGSFRQAPVASLFFLRTSADPTAVFAAARRAIRDVHPALAVYDERTLGERVGQALARLRFGAVLLGSFAALGLLLAVIGIYAVLAYSVEQRTREVGIRLALGAVPREVVTIVMGRAMGLAAVGIALGLATAWGLSRFLQGLVFGISATDPVTFAAQAVALSLVCAVAAYIPARRAARVDPVHALRAE